MNQPLAGRHIAVLMGGPSAEREVSLVTGAACADALERQGAKVSRVDPGKDVAQVLTRLAPDLVYNALHGVWGEDGCVQGVLETLKLPYTHSGVLASALAMDKTKAKAVLAAAGVTVPGGGLYNRHDVARDHVLQPPYVVKPNAEGSSVGVFMVFQGANRPPQELSSESWTYGEEVVVEPYIQGLELAVAVLGESNGPRGLAVTEIRASTGFYDYDAKYSEGGSEHVLPAKIPEKTRERALRMAEAAHTALGCRGVTRSDFRYDDINDLLVLLEVNTQPGMTPTSLAPEQAAHVGISFDQLVFWIVEDAYARCNAGGPPKPRRPRAEAPASPNKARSAPPKGAPAAKLHAAKGVGLSPAFALGVAGAALGLGLVVMLATGHRAERLVMAARHGVDGQFASAGFKLKTVHIQGASGPAQADIMRASGLFLDQPTLGLDLADVRQRVQGVGWVKDAKVVRLLPDTVVIAVEERPALAVWQSHGRMRVIDGEGRVIREADAARFPQLPLVVGQGADQAAGSILPAVAARPRLRDRLEALVRVDDRRWDLRLKDGSLIQLPAIDEESALIQLDQLDQRQRILDLGFARIDLRDPEMVAVRPRDAALPGQIAADGA